MRQGRERGAASRLQMASEWPALRTGHSFLGVLGVLVVLARHQACASGLRAWPATIRPQGLPLSSGWAARKDCRFPVAGPPARNFIGLWAARTPKTPRTARMRQGREWGAASRLQMTSEWPALRTGHSFLGVLGVLVVLARHQACASGLRAFPANCLAPSKRSGLRA